MLFTNYFPRWRLTIDGADRSLEGLPYKGLPFTHFMAFDLNPGEYKIEFKSNAIDYLALIISLLGVALLFAFILSTRVSYRIL